MPLSGGWPGRSGSDGTLWRDLLMLALMGFVALVILLLPHINPPGEAKTRDAEPPGDIVVEIRWPDESDADVDLWVQAPRERPVGYSNKGGTFFNLLRDDLGQHADATGLNYETSYSRGITPGEYTVNVHLYRVVAVPPPIPVTVVVSVKKGTEEWTRQILSSRIDLAREGQELTVFRFRLDAEGNLVAGSVHALQKPLRAANAAD